MRIILEGPDNAGKTTLAQRLALACGPEVVQYLHPGGRPNDIHAELGCLEDQLDQMRRGNVILDRVTSISQRVYNPDDEHDRMRADYWELMMRQNPVVIYCRPSTDKLLRTQDLTWREGESEEHKEKIIRGQHMFVERYDKLFNTIPCISYDYDDAAHREIIYQKLYKGLLGSIDDEMWFRTIMNRRF